MTKPRTPTLSSLGREPEEQRWRLLTTQKLDYLALNGFAHGLWGHFTAWVGFVMQALCFQGMVKPLSDNMGRRATALAKLSVHFI